jgi:hypothetical protein
MSDEDEDEDEDEHDCAFSIPNGVKSKHVFYAEHISQISSVLPPSTDFFSGSIVNCCA